MDCTCSTRTVDAATGELAHADDCPAATPARTGSDPDVTVVDGEVRAHFTLADGEVLQVVVTTEGVIFDGFDGDEHVGTRAMTADEWFDTLV